jgi:putative SOS response-associated peptidase YedK
MTLEDFLREYEVKPPEYEPYYHVSAFVHPQVPVMTIEEPHKVETYMWGLAPIWAKDRSDAQTWAKQLLNATCEKAASTYKPYFKSKRCLVFVNGFYEWRWEDPKGKVKTPYFIYAEDRKPFTFGGIYNNWVDRETGQVFDTFSIVTTPANELMTEIHNNKKRMPLIIDKEQWGRWLDPAADVGDLLRTYPDGFLKAHSISRNITARGFNTNVPEIQAEYSETLF